MTRNNKCKNYFNNFPIYSNKYNIVRISCDCIKNSASKYFSGRLLDIGCGSKNKQLLIDEYVNTYIGLDHLDCIHDQSNIDVFGSAYHIPFKDDSFDSVICTAVLEHLEEPESAMRETYRVLRPGGCAIYTIPFFWHLHEEPKDFYRFSKYGLRYLFEKCSFKILELTSLSGFWITFGTEFNYFLTSVMPFKPLQPFLRIIITANNILFHFIDGLDRRFHPSTVKWTWLYLVTVQKNIN